jgi:hypothetical protein
LGRQNNYRPPQQYRRYNNGPSSNGPINRNAGGAPRYFRKNTFDNRRPRNMRSNNPNSSQYENVLIWTLLIHPFYISKFNVYFSF